MTTQYTVRTNGSDRYYRTNTPTMISSTKALYELIISAAANRYSFIEAFEKTQQLTPFLGFRSSEAPPPADRYIYYDLDNYLMSESSRPEPPPMEMMPDTIALEVHKVRLMQSNNYSLANLLRVERHSNEWLSHATVEMAALPLHRHTYYHLDEVEEAEWRDALNSKVVAIRPHPTQPGHRIYWVTGINPDRLASFHAAIAGKVEEILQWEHEVDGIVSACKAAANFNDPEYPESAYPWAIAKCNEPVEITTSAYTEDYGIRNGFVYKDIAFVQQVEGGDEWLALKKCPDGWVAFESYSLAHMVDSISEAHCVELIEKLANVDWTYLIDTTSPEQEPAEGPADADITM